MSAVMCDCGLMDLWLRTHSQQCTAMLIVAGFCYSSAPATVITGTLAAVLGHVGRRWTSRKLCQRRATVSCARRLAQFSTYSALLISFLSNFPSMHQINRTFAGNRRRRNVKHTAAQFMQTFIARN